MFIRPYTVDDLEEVRSLHERFSQFPLPDFNEPQYIVKEIAEEDGQTIALGAIRLTSEVMTIMNLDLSKKLRAEAVERLLQVGIFKSQKFGVDETHAFLTGVAAQTFAKVLKRKFGFVNCQGTPLTLRY